VAAAQALYDRALMLIKAGQSPEAGRLAVQAYERLYYTG
jgi:hypothetical protein